MRRLFVAITTALALTGLLAGVADAGDNKPKNVRKAKAGVEDAYECFLSGALGYDIAQRLGCVAEVEADPEFLALATDIQEANADITPLVEPVVGKISFPSATTARVRFEVEINGEPTLVDQRGGAVLMGRGREREWKVSAKTFCDLSALFRPDIAAAGPCAPIIANDRL